MASKTLQPNQTDVWTNADRVYSGLTCHVQSNACGGYAQGTVATPQGFVKVYSQGLQYGGPTPLLPATGAVQYTRLSIILGGREKQRVIDEAYSERRLATLAKEFAVEAAREALRTKEKEGSHVG